MDEAFDLVFRGELLDGFARPAVEAAIAKITKADAPTLVQLFSGRAVVIRKGADRATATRYQQAFQIAGARLRVIAHAQTGASATASATSAQPSARVTRASDTQSPAPVNDAPSAGKKMTLAERLAAQSGADTARAASTSTAMSTAAHGASTAAAAGQMARTAANTPRSAPQRVAEQRPGFGKPAGEEPGEFGIAPTGSDLLRADERPLVVPITLDVSQIQLADNDDAPLAPRVEVPELDIDTSHLSLAPPGTRMEEEKLPVRADVDVSAMSLAPAGADLGVAREVTPVNVDVSGIDLLPPGTELGVPAKKPDAKAPDTSHIKLQ